MKHAFTLVELIVVITILGILSTVGFVSYSSYLTTARDSNRISQLTKLSDSMQVYSANRRLPIPDDNVEIQASGSLVAYQGYAGRTVLQTVDFSGGGVDPKDDSYFTYYATRDRGSFQLLAFMEESTLGFLGESEVHADYLNRFPKVYGKKLGALTYDGDDLDIKNTPVQELESVKTDGYLDILNTTDIYTAHIDNGTTDKLTGTGGVLSQSIPQGSCKRIKETGIGSVTGPYYINPAGYGDDINLIQVWCEMIEQGGGWTLVARSTEGGAGDFGWLIERGNVEDFSQPYSMGVSVQNIPFTEIFMTTHTGGPSVSYQRIWTFSGLDSSLVSNGDPDVVMLIPSNNIKNVINSDFLGSGPWYWGRIGQTFANYQVSQNSNGYNQGLSVDGFEISGLSGEQGMIFVR